LAALSLFLALVPQAFATLPLPVYPECGTIDRPDLCPPDLGTNWARLDWIPEHSRETIRPAEQELGSGISLDRAFQTTTGRFDVLIAVGDTGVDWGHSDLVNKYFLNAGELPIPQGADGLESADHDFNGDGLFNIRDYAEDPRVAESAGQDRHDDRLDPSDLLAVFSDGSDGDGNGYIDDISGWDFFDRDNDPWASLETDYGEHGVGVAREMAAEGGNGGDIGTCPNCAILPLRTGDAFIIDGTRVVEAIAYAADMNAVGISLALGGMSVPSMADAAIEYAWDQGMTVVSVGGDENSYHHNQPAALSHVIYVKSMRHQGNESDTPTTTYMSHQNCNNFGVRMVLGASSRACATGASAVVTGTVGLVQSAARDAGLELHAGEVTQLLVGTADDVWLSAEEQVAAESFPSSEGWDPYYGYGRVHAARAVEAVAAGEIPPWLTIDSPDWFTPLDPRDAGSVSVRGSVSAERSSGFSWTAEFGVGADPREWESFGQGEGTGTEEVDFGDVDLSSIHWSAVPEPEVTETVIGRFERVASNAVTVRVRVLDSDGRTATMRRTFFLDADPDRLPGFPLAIGVSGESSVQLGDLDGDGVYEILFGTADGEVLALRGDGTPMPGWPVEVAPLIDTPWDQAAVADGLIPPSPDPFLSTLAIGDLDGDGSPEVVGATHFGGLYAWHADGSVVDGFPRWTLGRDPAEWEGSHWQFDQGYIGSPALWDLDDDGTLEIIAAAMDGRLYVLDHAGNDWGPYPIELCYPTQCGEEGYRIIASPTIGDVDGDGDPDIGIGTNEAVDERYSVSHLIDARTGEGLPGWPRLDMGLIGQAVLLPLVGEGHPSSMAFADIDGDGDLEISNPLMLGTSDVLHHDGEVALELPYYADHFGENHNVDEEHLAAFVQMATNPAWGDLNGDGVPDLVVGGTGTKYMVGLILSEYVDYQHPLAAWSGKVDAEGTGPMLPGFPRQVEDMQILQAASIADIGGDARPEIIYGSGGWVLHAWDSDGGSPAGWPKFTGGWMLGTPAVGDVTGDGYLDVVVATREGWLFAWSTSGRADVPPEWAGLRHDTHNTGNHAVAIAAQAGPPADAINPLPEEKGCCKKDKGAEGALLLFPLIGLAGLRRRRRDDDPS
jgi:hypothetical protein